MANNIYGAIGLITGATGFLDAIDGAALEDKDMAYVTVGGLTYHYILDVDSATAESSPTIISPDANAGDKRWILQGVRAATIMENKTAPSIATGDLPIDCNIGSLFVVALTEAITSFTMTNIPATGTFYGFVLELTMDGTPRAVTWEFSSVAVKWAGGTSPTLTSTNAKKDIFVFYTHDGGTSWVGAIVGQNL